MKENIAVMIIHHPEEDRISGIYGIYPEYIMVRSKIIFYLLRDGGNHELRTLGVQAPYFSIIKVNTITAPIPPIPSNSACTDLETPLKKKKKTPKHLSISAPTSTSTSVSTAISYIYISISSLGEPFRLLKQPKQPRSRRRAPPRACGNPRP